MDIFVGADAVSLGTENDAVSISDSDAVSLQRVCNVASGDYADVGGAKIATKAGLGLVVQAAAGNASLYIGAVTRGTPTHTAAGIVLKIGFLQD